MTRPSELTIIFALLVAALLGRTAIEFILDSDAFYWAAYLSISDVVLVLAMCAGYCTAPYSRLKRKTAWLCGVTWALFCLISNAVIDFTELPGSSGVILGAALTEVLVSLWVARYLLRFRPTHEPPAVNRLSVVIGRPRTLSGLLIAAWSGRGGSFAATDGVHVWRFRRYSGQFEKSLLTADYLRGKMVLDRGAIAPAHYGELAAMISTKWTIFTNCYSLLRRWV